nr:hypothetical protein [Tanacetum cinerariifolium]
FKGQGPVVEENTIDEAINVHEEDSDDDFVDVTNPSKQVTGSKGGRKSNRLRCKQPVVEENTIDEAINVHKEDSDDDFETVRYLMKQASGSNGETANVATKDTGADTEAGPSKSGFGLGEKEGPFVEENENGFLNELEGFRWKLGNYIEAIHKSKTCFGKTLAIGLEDEVLQTAKRVTSAKLKGKAIYIDDISSFSLGVTQDFKEYNSGDIMVVSTKVIQPIQAMPMKEFKNAKLSADVRYNMFKDYMHKVMVKDQRWINFKDVELVVHRYCV